MKQVYNNLITTFKNLDSIDKEEEILKQLEEIVRVLNSINGIETEILKNEEVFLDDTYTKIINIKEKMTELVKSAYDL